MLTDATFGGHPVEVDIFDGEVLVTCKGVTGTLDQMDHWLHNHYRDNFQKYYFGVGDKMSEIIRDGERVKIACLEDEYLDFKIRLNKFIHDVRRAISSRV